MKPAGEDETHFHLHDTRDNTKFSVAKKGLSKATHKQIAQHFAEGGEADGQDTSGATDSPFQLSQPLPDPPPTQDSSGFGSLTSMFVPKASGSDIMSGADKLANTIMGANAPEPEEKPAPTPKAKETTAPQEERPDFIQIPKSAPMKMGSGMSAGPSQDEMDANANQQKEAARSMADMERNRLDAVAANDRKGMEDEAIIRQKAQADIDANMKAQARLSSDIASQKIDFNRYWNDKSVPQKISGAIGMILGGLGGGMTHGPNQALQVINSAIERDVDQQKSELGKKQNQLSDLMRQGHDLREAVPLLIAQNTSAASGRMKAILNQYASSEQAPMLQQRIAELDQQSADRTMKTLMERAQIAHAQAETRKENMAMALNGDPMQQRQIALEIDHRMRTGRGVRQDDPAAAFVDPKTAVSVPGPGGHTYLRRTSEEGKKVIEKMHAKTGELTDTLSQIVALRNSMKAGTIAATAASTQAKILNDAAYVQMHDLSEIAKMGPEISAVYKEMLPRADATALSGMTQSKFTAAMNALNSTIQAKTKANYNAYLEGGRGVVGGSGAIGRLAGQ